MAILEIMKGYYSALPCDGLVSEAADATREIYGELTKRAIDEEGRDRSLYFCMTTALRIGFNTLELSQRQRRFLTDYLAACGAGKPKESLFAELTEPIDEKTLGVVTQVFNTQLAELEMAYTELLLCAAYVDGCLTERVETELRKRGSDLILLYSCDVGRFIDAPVPEPEKLALSGVVTVASVKFSGTEKEYDYITDINLQPGDRVMVPAGGTPTEAVVVAIRRTDASELPLPADRYRKVTRKLEGLNLG